MGRIDRTGEGWRMAANFVNPTPFLIELTGSPVVVRLKWGMEYKGLHKSTDKHMNLQLLDTEEWVDGALAGNLEEVLIRCNNVLFIRAAGEEKSKKRKTEGDQ